jgi:hypothetical protein
VQSTLGLHGGGSHYNRDTSGVEACEYAKVLNKSR